MSQSIPARTQVAIIGGGPAGLLLSHLLDRSGIESVVLEKKSRDYVLARIRAGVLEWSSVELLQKSGLGDRMKREGRVHDSIAIAWAGKNRLAIDTKAHTGMSMMAYGQTALTEDLYAARDAAGGVVVHQAEDVVLHDLESQSPSVTLRHDGRSYELECDYIAGCDGFHGVSRQSIPAGVLTAYENSYPFGWLGIMSRTPPLEDIMYATHPRGFALASMRNPFLSRYYIQCPLDTVIDEWPDDRFWAELKSRFPPEVADVIVTGPSIEKSIAPLKSFVSEPMSYGRLYLAGDAAHVVPPTGAKGLNLAVSDVFYLSRALEARYRSSSDELLRQYSDTALKRVWGAVRFSWYLTSLLHRFPNQTPFNLRAQEVELDYIANSPHAQASICEQFVGMPY